MFPSCFPVASVEQLTLCVLDLNIPCYTQFLDIKIHYKNIKHIHSPLTSFMKLTNVHKTHLVLLENVLSLKTASFRTDSDEW
jgi:hypothetical protein